MRNWINNNRRGIELAIVLLLLVSREWTLAVVLGIVWGLEDEKDKQYRYSALMGSAHQYSHVIRDMDMRALIYRLYYDEKITQEIAHQLLDQLEKSKLKARRY